MRITFVVCFFILILITETGALSRLHISDDGMNSVSLMKSLSTMT